MNKIIASIVGIGVIALVATLVIQGRSASSAPPIPPDLGLTAPSVGRAPLLVECFELIEAKTPDEPVRLVTKNFGGDVVQVGRGQMMCEDAKKQRLGVDPVPPPYGSTGRFVFECFRLDEGDDPSDPFTLQTANFGEHAVKVRRAETMCESAKKEHVFPDGTTRSFGRAGLAVWQCFAIESNVQQQVPVALSTANFGLDDGVQVLDPYLMCEEARKHTADPTIRDVGQANGLVWECFRITFTEFDEPADVLLSTHNFGEDPAIVGIPVAMCERARKIPVASFEAFPVLTATPTPRATDTPPPGEPTVTPTPAATPTEGPTSG